jgi:hypothetical protein
MLQGLGYDARQSLSRNFAKCVKLRGNRGI